MDGRNTNVINNIIGYIKGMNERLNTLDVIITNMKSELNSTVEQLNKLVQQEDNEVVVEDDTTSPFTNTFMGNFVGDFNGNLIGNMTGQVNVLKLIASYYSTSHTGIIAIPEGITTFELKGLGDSNTVIIFPKNVVKGQVIMFRNDTETDVNLILGGNATEILNTKIGKMYINDGTIWKGY